MTKCPVCGEGYLTAYVHKNKIHHGGCLFEVDCHGSVCNACGSEITTPEQINLNAKIANEVRKL